MYGVMRPTTVYEMHIFKDVNKTSWTNPQIHTFQLTEDAASPFLADKGSRGGLKNLRRCSPAQLSFLQAHLAGQNAALKSAREAEKKAQKEKELHQKKEAQKQEEKRAEEAKKWQESMEQKASKLEDDDNEIYSRIFSGEQDDAQCYTLPNTSFSPYRHTYPVHPCRARNNVPIYSPRPFPVYHPGPPPPPPPPPPPGYTTIKKCRPTRENLPLQQESDWCLECVELDLVTVVIKPKVEKPKASLGKGQRHRNHSRDYPRPRPRGKLPMLGYQLAESANVEFAVIYSRTVMTAVPQVVPDRRVDRIYYADSYDGGSVYEYGSDQEIDLVSDGEVEVEDGDKDKEEEDDLEIVERFRHCHPITESMSNCCLEK